LFTAAGLQGIFSMKRKKGIFRYIISESFFVKEFAASVD